MLNKNIHTIEEHQKIVGSRFELAQIIMNRTKQLMAGSPIKPGLSKEFVEKRKGEIPTHRLSRVALEELRTGKLKWKSAADCLPTVAVDPNDTVFVSE